jgi:hypothetical protein
MTKFSHEPSKPKSSTLLKSYFILLNAHSTASSFFDTFEKTRKVRKATGTPTDEEQDLLRAMLLFSSSGLDSMIKQLIQDTLPKLIEMDEINSKFKAFIESRLSSQAGINIKLLSEVLTSQNSREALKNELVQDLLSGSLQSKEQIYKVASFFNINEKELNIDKQLIKDVFAARNYIVHEMDVDFNQPNRTRRPRKKEDMKKYCNEIFKISNNILNVVDRKVLEVSQSGDKS